MKRVFFLTMLITLLFIGSAQATKEEAPKQTAEVSLNIGTFLNEVVIGGMISVGSSITNKLGVEASTLIAPEDVVISGNLSLILPIRRVIPFGTIGLGICIHGVPILNGGGGDPN